MAYQDDLALNTLTDLNAVVDTVFNDRNNEFLFEDEWNLLAAYYLSANALRVRSNWPRLNHYNRHHVFGINRSATNPSPLNIADYRDSPILLPKNQQIGWQAFNDGPAMGTENSKLVMIISDSNWSRQLPTGLQQLTVRATASAAGTANAWGADAAITMADQDLESGVYSVIGCQVFDAGSIAYRFVANKPPIVQGFPLRPGGLCLEAIANIPVEMFSGGLGEWFRFHTFTLPRIQIFANATAASTQEIRLQLAYLGEDQSLLMMR